MCCPRCCRCRRGRLLTVEDRVLLKLGINEIDFKDGFKKITVNPLAYQMFKVMVEQEKELMERCIC